MRERSMSKQLVLSRISLRSSGLDVSNATVSVASRLRDRLRQPRRIAEEHLVAAVAFDQPEKSQPFRQPRMPWHAVRQGDVLPAIDIGLADRQFRQRLFQCDL